MSRASDILGIDPAAKEEELVGKIKKAFADKGFSKAVLGLSGGIDSAVTASLLVKALGKENVKAFIMPYKGQDTADAGEMARLLGIAAETVDITPMVDAYFSVFPDADKLRRGNKMARERMSILYDQSRKVNALVVGTGNKTEINIGYFTQHGDGACAVAPLASLYKTQLRQLAGHLNIPSSILEKKPSAGLWDGQTDEDEIGASYEELDLVLFYLESGKTADEITKEGIDRSVVELVRERMEKNKFKLEGPALL
jgi:NAD+ synthase